MHNPYLPKLDAFQLTDELQRLKKIEGRKPAGWELTPQAVVWFLSGHQNVEGRPISPKYIGPVRRIELAVAALATQRGLLLTGPPGTGKSMMAYFLAMAISGETHLLVQGTAGTLEEHLRYGWNYAMLLNQGPERKALVPSAIFSAMENGKIVRIEELNRLPTDIQDSLLGILSERQMTVPELNWVLEAQPGFHLIATANTHDAGIFPLSAALQRRFHTVLLPYPTSAEEQIAILLAHTPPSIIQDWPFEMALHHVVQQLLWLAEDAHPFFQNPWRTEESLFSPLPILLDAVQHLHAFHLTQPGISLPQALAAALGTLWIKNLPEDWTNWQSWVKESVSQKPEWADLYPHFSAYQP